MNPILNMECLKQTPLNFQDLRHLIVGFKLNENNIKMQQIFSCSFKRNGYEHADNSINEDKLKHYTTTLFKNFKVDDDFAKRYTGVIAEHCSSQSGTNMGQRALKVINCTISAVAKVIAASRKRIDQEGLKTAVQRQQ